MRPIDYFDRSAARFPDRTAIIDGDLRLTYAEAREATERIARGLWAAGLRPENEEKIAIYSPNNARLLLCILGVMRAGAVWVPVNARSPVPENGDFMVHADASWLIYHSSFSDTLDELRARVPALRHFICLDAENGNNASLDALMARGDGTTDIEWADAFGNPDRPLVITSTGGTTGVAKAVLVNNLSWSTMIDTGLRHVVRNGEVPVCLAPMPLTHGARGYALITFAAGGTNVIMPKFDAVGLLRQIDEHHVTHMFLPPTAFYTLLAEPKVRDFDYSSLRVLILSGAPMSADKLRAGIEIFGPCLGQAYGQVESPTLVTWLDPDVVARAVAGDHPERLMSCGIPTAFVRVAIVDDAGRALPEGERGEIVVRSHLVTPGYHKNPEASVETKAGGWHHTGDVGYLDADGFLYLVDRKKQIIITGGFNVYPAEVEAALMELAAIRDCAVIGVPDAKWGEAIKAIVIADAGQPVTEAEIIAHCKERLGGVKAPKTVEFRQDLPRTAVGKVDKKVIRKPYWEGHERAI